MTYTGNQMKTVNDAVADIALNTSMDFKDYSNVATEYTYNRNGAMSQDLNKGISSISYNSLNLPRMVDIKNKTTEGRNEYTYSASGQKLKAVQRWNPNYSTTPVIGSTINTAALTQSQTTDYVGNIIYENNTLKRILVDGGYYESGNYYFYITDHLGNNRIVTNAAASVVQSTQYYPFGSSFADATAANAQPYKYNGKELDARNGLNMYDYSARWKDDFRFTTVDPLAEKYYSISPYAYCNNNPIKYVDLKGDSLTLVGNQSDIQATVDIHNANVGPYSNVTVNSSGLVSKTSIYAQYGEQVAGMMDAAAQVLMTPEQRAYAKTLDKIINDTKMTTINVENGTAVFIGDIDKAIIDIGDISNLPASNSPITRASALIHETDEQYRVQVKNISNWPAHKQATRTESLQVGYQMDPIREHVTVGNEGIMHVRSADGRHNAIVHTRNNNIVKVVSW